MIVAKCLMFRVTIVHANRKTHLQEIVHVVSLLLLFVKLIYVACCMLHYMSGYKIYVST